MNKHWGFDVRDRDTTIRAQDDFYTHSAGTWLKKNPIPKTESRWGSFMILRYDTDLKLHEILKELETTKSLKSGTPEQMIRDFFRSGQDMERRNALGVIPLNSLRTKIRALKDFDGLQKLIAELHVLGIDVPFGAGIDQDSKNSEKYILHFYQSGLGMPDRDYYLKDDAESKRVREAYVPHIASMLGLLGYTKNLAIDASAVIVKIETALAKISMNKVDRRDADKVYHKKTVRELAKLAPEFEWKSYLKRIGAPDVATVIVMQPDFVSKATKLLSTISLSEWQTYLEWQVLNEFASFLSHSVVKRDFAFYGTVLSGVKEMKPLWRRTLGVVNGTLGELLGRLYVAKHFPPAAKKKMNVLVNDLFEAYEERIRSLDWMSPATKKKALLKLGALNRKIGYPDKWKSYKGLRIVSDDFVANVLAVGKMEHKRAMKKLSKPIDRGEWFMFPQTVNAYFAPNLNDIVFPAAILQPPFFSLDADDAINYGAIGTVIGHEITHGFDDQGAKYDAKGNLKDWWTADDKKRFQTKAEVLRKQFDQYEVADGVKVNGKLTLGENIADLGGAVIAYNAYMNRLRKTGRADIEGFTPEQRFFYGFALFERENTRPEFQKMAALTDPHSPGIFRINGPASNLAEFYEAFGVKKGDALFRDSSKRARIW